MISFLSRSVVRSLIKNDIIEMEKAEVYQYGFEILFSSIATFLIALFYCSNAFFRYICNVSANMRRISCKSLLELQFTVLFGNQCGIGCISFLSY